MGRIEKCLGRGESRSCAGDHAQMQRCGDTKETMLGVEEIRGGRERFRKEGNAEGNSQEERKRKDGRYSDMHIRVACEGMEPNDSYQT